MSVRILNTSFAGTQVTVTVTNSELSPKTVMVSVGVLVGGNIIEVTSERTTIPANASGVVHLYAPGVVERISDGPDPTVLIEDDDEGTDSTGPRMRQQ